MLIIHFNYSKFKRIILSILIVLLIPNFSYSFSNEPNNFNGIKWGEDIKRLENMNIFEISENKKQCFYTRLNEKLQIGDAKITKITYAFHKGKYYGSIVSFSENENFLKLKQFMLEKYGNGTYDPNNPVLINGESVISWGGTDISLGISYDEKSQTGSLHYFYDPIMLQTFQQ